MALKCVFILVTIACFIANATGIRELPPIQAGFNLTARLETSGGLVDCWNALTELKSCSNEIVAYFTSGQTDIGPACCQAIRMITHHCWPAMLTSLGFTAEEGDILRGYCDAASGPAPTPSLQLPLAPNSMLMV
uniref:Putative egg cell-secreted protein 1.4 n=1 Tax=Davidia involucrata TaxID=16924 RepID=A0A5B6YWE7_DAVIN